MGQNLDVRTMSLLVNDPKRPSISSVHPGGANVTFGDLHRHYLRESISPTDLRSLFTIAGGERIIPVRDLP